MENQLYYCTIFISIVWIILIETWKRSNSKRNLPPGPWKLPIVGNIHQLMGSQLPHHRLAELAKKYGPIMHLQLGQVPTIVVSSAELAIEVTKTHDLIFATRPFSLAADVIFHNSKDVAYSPYGEYWRKIKKMCTTELLSAKRVQSFRSIREEEVSEIIRTIALSENVPVSLTKMVLALTRSVTTRTAFGMVREEKDSIIPIVDNIEKVFVGLSVVDLFPSVHKLLQFITGMGSEIQKIHEQADAILEEIIKKHRERNNSHNNEADDLLNVLLNLQHHASHDDPLTTEEIKAIILDLFVAGIDTTTKAIQWTMSEIIKHPKVMERAQAEVRQVYNGSDQIDETLLSKLTYLNAVFKEGLRLHPPLTLLVPREAREEVEICGYTIPKRTQLIINAHMIARDPNYWTEPDKFYPERFLDSSIDYKGTDYQFIPFGAGRRMCPGVIFATAVAEVLLANLLYHFDWKMPNQLKPEDLDMSEDPGLTVGRKNELFMIPIRYNPSQLNKI